jgi:hypothetical protein
MGSSLLALFNRNAATLSSFPEPSAITPHLPVLLSMKNPDFINVNTHLTSIIGGSSPPFPFPSVHDYYRFASSHHSLSGIRIPFLAINALDDPIVAEVPLEELGKNPLVSMVLTKQGGHLGWFVGGALAGWGAPPTRWNVQPCLEWLGAIAEDFVETRPNGSKGRKRFADARGFVMEEGSGPFVGYRVKAVGLTVQAAVAAPGAVPGL